MQLLDRAVELAGCFLAAEPARTLRSARIAPADLPSALCKAAAHDSFSVRTSARGTFGKMFGFVNDKNPNITPTAGRRGQERKKAPLCRTFRMRSSGLEPPRAVKPTRPSTLRVYQFRHERRVREYSLATAAGIGPLLAGSNSPRRRAATQSRLQRGSPQLASVHSRRYSANTCSFQRHHPAKLGAQQTWI
jgi:hypothetical protein